MSKQVTRRRFIQAGLGTIGALTVASCAQPAPAPAAQPAATQAPAAPAATKAPAPAAASAAPKVYLWSNMIALSKPEGSDPERLEEVRKYILEKAGVDPYGYVPPTGAAGTEKLNLTLGSKTEELDIFSGGWGDYKDAVQPLNDLLQKYGQNIVKAHTKENWAGVSDSKGTIWGIPRLGLMGHVDCVFMRQDWLKEMGMPLPQTWDDLEKYIAEAKKKRPDALVATSNAQQLAQASCGAFTKFGYSNWIDPKDSKVKPPELQEGYKDWVAKMAEWWKKDYFFKETFNAQSNWADVFKPGNFSTFIGWYSVITIQVQRLVVANTIPGMFYEVSWDLKGPQGLARTNRLSGGAAIMITKKSKNPDAVMKFINWQYDPGKDNLGTVVYGIKGKDWEWADEKNKYYINRLINPATPGSKIYAGEFMAATGLGTDTWSAPNDDLLRRHYEQIRDYALNYSHGKMPVDYDIPYDLAVIKKEVPGLADIGRMIPEETIKFITNVRPIGEWDNFIKDLDKAGMQDWITAYTKQYNDFKKK